MRYWLDFSEPFVSSRELLMFGFDSFGAAVHRHEL